jgi:hypothetical protein
MVDEVVSLWRADSRTAANSVPAGSSPDRMRSAISMPISKYRDTIVDLMSHPMPRPAFADCTAPGPKLVLRTVGAQTGSEIIIRGD